MRRGGVGRLVLGRLLVLALAVGLAACSEPATPSNRSTGGPDVGPTPVVTRFEIGRTVWVDGFVVTIHTAIASLDAKGGPVSILIRIENPGTDGATLDAPIRLIAAGDAFELARGTSLPELDPGAAAELTIEFEVVGLTSIGDGVLLIGRTEDHQVRVPFGPGAVKPITLEPQAFDLTGAATAGSLRVALKRGIVRWDLPDWHAELPITTEALTLTYDATYTATFAGGFAFTAANVGLRLPDGTVLAPRSDGHSQSIQAIGPKQTVPDLESRFEIPTGLTGKFGLIIRDGTTQKTISFTIGT